MEKPAFPTTRYYDEEPIGVEEGMTLRDYFAAKAMCGILAAMKTTGDASEQKMAEDISGVAYVVADAMLAERKKGK
jgi:hypothetical protein